MFRKYMINNNSPLSKIKELKIILEFILFKSMKKMKLIIMQIKKVKVIYWGMEKIIWRKKIFNKINTKISFDNDTKKFITK